ncbi:MAG: endonuclease/exonuclease/phosphatase family protein [Bacteroidetes bacterium]|nr:endonuclease/exonuclease/phosphatase family protein [Bacteroidota bacterium]
MLKKILFYLFKRLVVILAFLLFSALAFLTLISVNDHKPPDISFLSIKNSNARQIQEDSVFSIISWNLGYCGLGEEMDFFYDGGKQVRANQVLSSKYTQQNIDFIESQSTIDFWFFQEVDQYSKRSYFIDQSEKLILSLNKHNAVYANNYKVLFVPVPVFNPMGKVNAGMMTFSKYYPKDVVRKSYPNLAKWPKRLFLLDRCLILSRFSLENNKELVLINTHNSYYVNDSSLRQKELTIIKRAMTSEFAKGNYVIAGGDWNILPPDFEEKFKGNLNKLQTSMLVFSEDFIANNWKWIFDKEYFTHRELNTPFNSESKKSTIDYFIVSPNVEIVENYVFPLAFKNSDHNPVFMKFKLKNLRVDK